MDDDDQNQDQVDEVEPKIILSKENIEEGLSQLYRVPDGDSSVWGTITCEEKEPPVQNLQDVNEKSESFGQCELLKYQYVRFLKLNNNALTSIGEVEGLKYLLDLQAKNNQITDIDFMAKNNDVLQYLQKADLSTNKITALPQVKCQSLFNLNLEENEIATADLFGHVSLKTLNLNKNKLTTCRGLTNLPVLEDLSIQENELTSLDGLSDLPMLKKLNLANNKLESLVSLCTLESVEVLNLEGNPIAKVDDLYELNKLRNLVDLNMTGCLLAEEKGDDLKKEVLIACERLPRLKLINGEEWTEEDRQEAMALKEERIQEALNKPPEEDGEEKEAEGDQ